MNNIEHQIRILCFSPCKPFSYSSDAAVFFITLSCMNNRKSLPGHQMRSCWTFLAQAKATVRISVDSQLAPVLVLSRHLGFYD